MGTALAVVGVVVLAAVVWSVYAEQRIVGDLSTRPAEQWQIAGLDRSAELARHARWGISPWRMRRLRRRLDEAARFVEERRRVEG